MADASQIFVGKGEVETSILLRYANRHGLITGATGTGKTVTLQGLAEGFSNAGVPVFMADVKGDLAGVSQAGGGNPKIEQRATEMGLAPLAYSGFPVVFWDLFGKKGHPIRATISEMGPLLLSRLLNLNDTQEGVLNLVFKLADDDGLLLLDLKDLRAMLSHVAERAKELQIEYGNVNAASVGAIQRSLLTLEQQGGEAFFGEPALELGDFMRTDLSGKGIVSLLAADALMENPRLYATFLLWLLSELFEELPEVGDLDKPKLVFFFDEAHLLFEDAPKALVDKVEQVVRLIRSKGVGVYFISQNPLDVPDEILGQMGNRVQHALRAFTPRDQKAVASAAETFRPNPAFDVTQVITELAVGEALVSFLGEKGAPSIVQRVFIRPPLSRLGPVTEQERAAKMAASPLGGKYDATLDRESAFELLKRKTDAATAEAEAMVREEEARKEQERFVKERDKLQREAERAARSRRTYDEGTYSRTPSRARRGDTVLEAAAKSAVRSASSQLGRSIVRGILGSILKGR